MITVITKTYSVMTGAVAGRGEGVPEDPPGKPDPVATEVLRDTPDTDDDDDTVDDNVNEENDMW